jgi:hypothetical protein
MGANRQRVHPFKKGASRLWKSLSDYRNAPSRWLLASQPSSLASQLLLKHELCTLTRFSG